MSKLPSFFSCVLALLIGLIAGECISFWNFFAEDAYILMRYSINLKAHGQWVYNINDYITVMTSPLHGILESIFYFITNELPYTNKIVSFITYLIITAIGFRYFKGNRLSQVLFLVFFSASPFVIFWTMGGLETPYLSLLVFYLIYLINKLLNEYSLKRILILATISGLCFICRYDSILFIICIFPFIIVKFGWKPALIWGVFASVIPIIWLLFSYHYFGDIFPTSFYIKLPNFSDSEFIIKNLKYSIDFFIVSGVLPFLILIFIGKFSNTSIKENFRNHFRKFWFAYIGLYLIFLYGIGTATLHMMFSYRMFVPYLSVIAFLIADFIKQSENILLPKYFSLSAKIITLLLIILNTYTATYIKNISINPFREGDYHQTNLTEYENFMNILAEMSDTIIKHWKTQPKSATRSPRIISYAEGVISYVNPDAYIYGGLVSYRKKYDLFGAFSSIDYFLAADVINHPISDQIYYPEAEMEKVYDKSSMFEGKQNHWYVYFKAGINTKNPMPNNINDTCRIGN